MRKFLIKVGGDQYEVEVEEVKNGKSVSAPAKVAAAPVAAKATAAPTAPVTTSGSARIDAPMPGNVLKINVKVGDVVKKGQTVFVLEAMKMENEISASAAGKVVGIQANIGDTVSAGQTIIVLE